MKTVREFSLETKNDKIAFLPGEILRGELYITLEEKTEVKSIKIFLQGEGAGKWLQQACGDKLMDHTKDGDGKLAKRMLLEIGLRAFGNSSKEDKIPQIHDDGRYVYEFQFRIPENLPPTFKSPIERDLGFVRYYLKAILSRPRKNDKIARLNIIMNELISPDRPELSFLPGSSESKPVTTNCMSSGTIFLESCLSRSYYVQGEKIMINATAENESTRIMKEVYAKLIRRVRCKVRFGTKTYTTDTASTHSDRIPASGKLQWKNHELVVPSVGPTVNTDQDVRVDYFVRVGMCEDYGSEVHLDLPVVIGTVGTQNEMKKRQEKEAEEEYNEKRKREQYRMKCIKDGEEREKYREELDRRVGHFDGINIAEDENFFWIHGPDGGPKILFEKPKSNRNRDIGPSKRSLSAETFGNSRKARSKPRERKRSRDEKSKSATNLSRGSRSSSTEGEKLSSSVERSKSLEDLDDSKDWLTGPSNLGGPLGHAPSKKKTGRMAAEPTGGRKTFSTGSLSGQRGNPTKEPLKGRSTSYGAKQVKGTKKTQPGRSKSADLRKPASSKTGSSERLPKSNPDLTKSAKDRMLQQGKAGSSSRKPYSSGKNGDDNSEESLYVYRGSVLSESDIPLAFSRSLSQGTLENALRDGESDLTRELMTSKEGRIALTEGKPISKESRRRMLASTHAGGHRKGERIAENRGKPESSDKKAHLKDETRNDIVPEGKQSKQKHMKKTTSKVEENDNSIEQSQTLESEQPTGYSFDEETSYKKQIKRPKSSKTRAEAEEISVDESQTHESEPSTGYNLDEEIPKQTQSKRPKSSKAKVNEDEISTEKSQTQESELSTGYSFDEKIPKQKQSQQKSTKAKEEEDEISAKQSHALESEPQTGYNGEETPKQTQSKLPKSSKARVEEDGNSAEQSQTLESETPADYSFNEKIVEHGLKSDEEDENKPTERTREEMERLHEFEQLESVFQAMSPKTSSKYMTPVENADESNEEVPKVYDKDQSPNNTLNDTPRPPDDIEHALGMSNQPQVFEFEKISGEPYQHSGLLDVPMSPIHEESAEYDDETLWKIKNQRKKSSQKPNKTKIEKGAKIENTNSETIKKGEIMGKPPTGKSKKTTRETSNMKRDQNKDQNEELTEGKIVAAELGVFGDQYERRQKRKDEEAESALANLNKKHIEEEIVTPTEMHSQESEISFDFDKFKEEDVQEKKEERNSRPDTRSGQHDTTTGNNDQKPKSTPWGFIGGAVGKFLGKLKPKQQANDEFNETEQQEKVNENPAKEKDVEKQEEIEQGLLPSKVGITEKSTTSPRQKAPRKNEMVEDKIVSGKVDNTDEYEFEYQPSSGDDNDREFAYQPSSDDNNNGQKNKRQPEENKESFKPKSVKQDNVVTSPRYKNKEKDNYDDDRKDPTYDGGRENVRKESNGKRRTSPDKSNIDSKGANHSSTGQFSDDEILQDKITKQYQTRGKAKTPTTQEKLLAMKRPTSDDQTASPILSRSSGISTGKSPCRSPYHPHDEQKGLNKRASTQSPSHKRIATQIDDNKRTSTAHSRIPTSTSRNNSPMNSPSLAHKYSPKHSPMANHEHSVETRQKRVEQLQSRTHYSPPSSTGLGHGRHTSSSPMGRGRSPTKKTTTHGTRSKQQAHSLGKHKNTKNAQAPQILNEFHRRHGQERPGSPADSLDSQRSSASDARCGKGNVRKSPQRITDQIAKQGKGDSNSSDSPPKRIVCYYPNKQSTKIPHGQTEYLRQSSVSSVDSLFSVSSSNVAPEDQQGKCQTKKFGRHRKSGVPVREKVKFAPKQKQQKEREAEANEQEQSDEDQTAKAHPRLGTAVERQRYIDKMVKKSASAGKKPQTKGVVKNNSTDFMEYVRDPKMSSAKRGSRLKVSPKIMDSPARSIVTQAPSTDIVQPDSPLKRRHKNPYAHVESPTKKLMNRKVTSNSSKDQTKRRTVQKEPSPTKTRTPSPTKAIDQRSPSKKLPQDHTKVPYVSPYKQSKLKKINKSNDQKNILIYSYNPDGKASVEEVKRRKQSLFEKEKEWKTGILHNKIPRPKFRCSSAGSYRDAHNNQFGVKDLLNHSYDDGLGHRSSERVHSSKMHDSKAAGAPSWRSKSACEETRNQTTNHRRNSRSIDGRFHEDPEAEKRRRSLQRQRMRDEKLADLRNKYNAEKTQFIQHAQSHHDEIRLTQSYPSDTKQPTRFSRRQNKPENKIVSYRRLPDVTTAARQKARSVSPRLTQSLDNRRSGGNMEENKERPYPGLSTSYDHLNFNYHSPYYRSRSTPNQVYGDKYKQKPSHNMDSRQMKKAWSPSDYYGYVESRGQAQPYVGLIEQRDKQSQPPNGKKIKQQQRKPQGKDYRLKAPYATDITPRGYDDLQFDKVYDQQRPLGSSYKNKVIEDEIIPLEREMLGDTGYEEKLIRDAEERENKEKQFEEQKEKNQRYIEEEKFNVRCLKEIPPNSKVRAIEGSESKIPRCIVQPNNRPYHLKMHKDEEYVPRSRVQPLLADDNTDTPNKQGDCNFEKQTEEETKENEKEESKQVTKEEMIQEKIQMNAGNKDVSETSKLPAVFVGKPSEKYVPSIDHGEPYTQSCMQNTPNYLIESGIVPAYNFFPIICSSHLPKKVLYPLDMKDLSHQDQVKNDGKQRSKSKSPERSPNLHTQENKRSRSHTPVRRSLKEESLNRKRQVSLNQEKTRVAETKVKKTKSKKKSNKVTVNNTSGTQKKQTFRSPRIVLREEDYKSKPVNQNKDHEPNCPQEEKDYNPNPPNLFCITEDNRVISVDSTEKHSSGFDFSDHNASRGERIFIGGGLTFSSPAKNLSPKQSPKHKMQKSKVKKTIKGGKVRSTKSVKFSYKSKQQEKPTKSKTEGGKKKRTEEIIKNHNKRIDAMDFFESVDIVEKKTKTFEEELKEIFPFQSKESKQTNSVQQETRPLLPKSEAKLIEPSHRNMNTHSLFEKVSKESQQQIREDGMEPLIYAETNKEPTHTEMGKETFSISDDSKQLASTTDQQLIQLINAELGKRDDPSTEVYKIQDLSCGFTSNEKSNQLAFESSTNKNIDQTNVYTTQTDSFLKDSSNAEYDAVLGIPHLSRYEKKTKKELEDHFKHNTINATPIILKDEIHEKHHERKDDSQTKYTMRDNNTDTHPYRMNAPQMRGTAPYLLSKDDSYDSFEQHERSLGILDEKGQARSNKQLLDSIYVKKLQQRILKRQRKNERLKKDLEEARHQRRSSCPPVMAGPREGILSVSDDAFSSEANTFDSFDETKEQRKLDILQAKNFQASKEPSNQSTYNTKHSTLANKQINVGGFGYQEEVIETFQYTEDRPLKKNIEDDNDRLVDFDVPIVTSETHKPSSDIDYNFEFGSRLTTIESDQGSHVSSDRDHVKTTQNRINTNSSLSSPSEERNLFTHASLHKQLSYNSDSSSSSPRGSGIPRWKNNNRL